MSNTMLDIRGIKSFYGSIMALRGVDITVNEGEIVTLIGANGAGKSNLMMTVFGTPRAREGRIIYQGRDIGNLVQPAFTSQMQFDPAVIRENPQAPRHEVIFVDAAVPNLNSFVQTLEERQGLKVACIEEIAFAKKFIDANGLKKLVEMAGKSDYGAYLKKVLKDAE